jgi:hypothetical protein
MLRRSCVSVSGGICGSRSAFRYVRGVKHRCTIFHARVALVRFPKKHTGTRYVELVLFLVGSVGHAEHCGISGARNIDALFFLLWWARSGLKKSAPRHVTPNMCFSRQCDLRVTLSILVRSRRETSTHYFSYTSCPGAVSCECVRGHVALNLCFCIRWDLRVT